jgi:tRNA nucleotidyltransferase/poly(A) polymerase
MKSFKEFVDQKKVIVEANEKKKDWKSNYIHVSPGFTPPSNLRPVVQAFLDSGKIELINDTSSKVTMPKKSLYLVGGAVRDVLTKGAPTSDLDLATNATPEQIAHILHAAGFKVRGDSSGNPDFDRTRTDDKGKKYPKMNISFDPSIKKDGDNKEWFLKGRDYSREGRPLVISALVNGDEFEIATFRKDLKTVNGKAEVDFTDDATEDAKRRDFTINSMYIELTKPEGENNKLFDPTGSGKADLDQKLVRAVGNAEERFDEDKLRVLRAIRFYCMFGNERKMDPKTKEAILKFKHLEGAALERVRQEFLKGLDHQDVDPLKYVSLYQRFGLLNTVFPGVSLNTNVPTQFRNKRDRYLALAWILQDNSIEKVNEVLSSNRKVGGETKPTGWSNEERGIVTFLIKLKEFDLDQLDEFLAHRKMYGVSKESIKRWVGMFDVVDGDKVKNPRPNWAKRIDTFANFTPDPTKLVTWTSRDESGKPTKELHPEVIKNNLTEIPPDFRGAALRDLNKKKLRQMFDDQSAA